MTEIEIDGKKIKAQEGSMLIDVADKLQIYIPHFCYHKKLSIAANCRMCLVEVENSSKPLPACATPISPGMIVHTTSDQVVQAQKSVMEFLLINHPLDCPICDQGGECQLQDLAVGYGKSSSRYLEEKRTVSPKDIGPLISMKEMSRCIHCTRCVRFGQEISGIMELGMSGRGENSEITTFISKTVNSELSGNMIDLCPVGALTSRPFRYSTRTWELSRRKSISPHDSLGSNLIIQIKRDKVARVLPLVNEEINECWISDKDRFSYEGLNSEERLTEPMLKKNGKWCKVKWQTALEYVACGLRSIQCKYGADAIAALGTPYSTLEELSLLQKVVRGIGSNNIDFRLRQSDFTLDGQINPWLGMSIVEFSQLNYIFIIGSFLRKDHPLLAARLRQALKNKTKFSILHTTDDDLLMPISTKIIQAPSAWLIILSEIMVAVGQIKNINIPDGFSNIKVSFQANEIAMNLLMNKSKAILLGNTATQHPKTSKLHAVAQWIAENTNAKFGYLTEGCNTVGGYLANALPIQGGANALQIFTQPRKAYLLLNAEPQLDSYNPQAARSALIQAKMVIIMSAYQHSMDYADVLLPIAPFTETSGTFINCEGRVQSFHNVVKPLGDTRPAWKVLHVLGNLLGLTHLNYDTSEAVRNHILNNETNIMRRLNNLAEIIPQPVINIINNNTLERVTDVPIYFSDPIVRRSSALLKTLDANPPKVWLPEVLAIKLKITNGDYVYVKQDHGNAILIAAIDKTLPKNVIRIAAGHISTANLGGMFDKIFIEKM